MSDFNGLIESLPVADIAAKLGVDEVTAKAAIDQALPALVAGMNANAQKPKGAASLERALAGHDGKLVEGGVSLADVDEVTGQKIVKNVFGTKTKKVVKKLDTAVAAPAGANALGGALGGIIPKLLPILAPIVMSWLASKVLGGGQKSGGAQQSGGGIGDILGGLLGGLGGGQSQAGGAGAAGGGIGDLLGGLLGKGSGAGGLGSILGGLFGR